MKLTPERIARYAGLWLLVFLASEAHGDIISVTSGDASKVGSATNLIVNGSFEIGNPGTRVFWAGNPTNPDFTEGGSTSGYGTPTGWNATGDPRNYSRWGGSGNVDNQQGAPFPDPTGTGLYFGSFIANSISETPTFNADGTVTFTGTPTIQAGNSSRGNADPVTLSQTVSGLSTSQLYRLEFWTTSENPDPAAFAPTFTGTRHDGIFGLDITGENRLFLATPTGTSALGFSQRYYIEFVPKFSDVTFTWTNWGHFFNQDGSAGGIATAGWTQNTITGELILDEVFLTAVPEPPAYAALFAALIGCYAVRYRRRQSRPVAA